VDKISGSGSQEIELSSFKVGDQAFKEGLEHLAKQTGKKAEASAPKITIFANCPQDYHREVNALDCVDKDGNRVAFEAETGRMGKVIKKVSKGANAYLVEFMVDGKAEQKWLPLKKLAVPMEPGLQALAVVRFCPPGLTKVSAQVCKDQKGGEFISLNYNGDMYRLSKKAGKSYLAANANQGNDKLYWIGQDQVSTLVTPATGTPHYQYSGPADHGSAPVQYQTYVAVPQTPVQVPSRSESVEAQLRAIGGSVTGGDPSACLEWLRNGRPGPRPFACWGPGELN
jgi:hypothetical protein